MNLPSTYLINCGEVGVDWDVNAAFADTVISRIHRVPFGGSPLLQQGELDFSPAKESSHPQRAFKPGGLFIVLRASC
jgi:hypothetical protein